MCLERLNFALGTVGLLKTSALFLHFKITLTVSTGAVAHAHHSQVQRSGDHFMELVVLLSCGSLENSAHQVWQ